MPVWTKYALLGHGIGVVLFALVEASDDIPPDHGLAALGEWRPSSFDRFECLVESIEAQPGRFGVSGNFALTPPADAESDLITLKSAGSTRQLSMAERAVEIRRFYGSTIEWLSCNLEGKPLESLTHPDPAA